jgi:hypothetical protein
MLGTLLILAIIVFGFNLMLGGKTENLPKILLWLVIAPVLVMFAYCNLIWAWQSAPVWVQILSILLVPFFIAALLRAMFPKAKSLQTLLAVIFQALIYLVAFPVRLLWRTSRFVFQRERQAVRLNPYRPAVGNRPPVINEREGRGNQNNFFER